MGYFAEFTRWDVPREQVSKINKLYATHWALPLLLMFRGENSINLSSFSLYKHVFPFFLMWKLWNNLLSLWHRTGFTMVCYSLLSSLIWYSVEDILQVLIVFAVESLELDFALLFPERHILLRVLPVLVVLATSSEKDSESLYKRVKINRLINIFKVT